MRLNELEKIIKNAIQVGAATALKNLKPKPTKLSKAQAYRLYGRSIVERWIKEKLIKPIITNDGHFKKEFLDRIELEAVAAASNRMTYLPVADR